MSGVLDYASRRGAHISGAATLRSPQCEMLRPAFATTSTFMRLKTFPYEGKGDRLRWMRSAIAKHARPDSLALI